MQLILLQESRAAIPIFLFTKALVGYLACASTAGHRHHTLAREEASSRAPFTKKTDRIASYEKAVLLCSSASGHLTPVPIHTRHRHLVLQVQSACCEVSSGQRSEAEASTVGAQSNRRTFYYGAVYLRDDSGSKLHFDLKSEEKRDLFANQKASISSFEGLPNKLLEAKDSAHRVNIRSTRHHPGAL
jgi:hypothetical protein